MTLAVKYRPKNLDEVVGQKTVIKAIKKILERKDVPKTWLFMGPSGTGKTTLARILANKFANNRAGPSNIIEIDAATNTGAEEMRAATGRANFKALGESIVKTHIVDEAHQLSQKAWDSLLKSTEEPPAHVYWILCSTNAGKIPDTIKTRCVKYTLKPVDEVEIFGLLVKIDDLERLNALPEVLEAIAEDSGGSPRQALTNLELCAHAETPNEARKLMRSALQMKGPVDLAKLIMGNRPPQWVDVTKVISSFENIDAEAVRIIIVNYIAGALMKAKSNNEAKKFLFLLDCFGTPYQTTDKMAPLLVSTGLALGLDQ
jgi:DNA polymerase III gamma/tau subunit